MPRGRVSIRRVARSQEAWRTGDYQRPIPSGAGGSYPISGTLFNGFRKAPLTVMMRSRLRLSAGTAIMISPRDMPSTPHPRTTADGCRNSARTLGGQNRNDASSMYSAASSRESICCCRERIQSCRSSSIRIHETTSATGHEDYHDEVTLTATKHASPRHYGEFFIDGSRWASPSYNSTTASALWPR